MERFKQSSSQETSAKRNSTNGISIQEINFEGSQAVLHTIVTSIYAQKIHIDKSNVVPILAMADYLQVCTSLTTIILSNIADTGTSHIFTRESTLLPFLPLPLQCQATPSLFSRYEMVYSLLAPRRLCKSIMCIAK